MNESRKLLDEQIESSFERLSLCDTEEERKVMVDELDTLYRLKIEEDKVISEDDDRYAERVYRDKELKNKNIIDYVNLGISVGAIVIPLVAYGRWFRSGLKFEETGVATSTFFKTLVNKMKFTK